MKAGFEIIDRYLTFCHNMTDNDTENTEWGIDQTVPQYAVNSLHNEVDLNTLMKCEESLDLFLTSTEELKTSSHSYTYVADVSNQHVNVDDGNKHFLDLDQALHENCSPCQVQKMSIEACKPTLSTLEHNNWAEHCLVENMDIESMLISQVKRDIDNEAGSLGISPDPTNWSNKNVHQWIEWNCVKHNLPKPNMMFFQMNGTTLCTLSEDDFNWKHPQAGSVFFSQLEIWRNASKLMVPNIPNSVYTEESISRECEPSTCGSPSPSVDSQDGRCSSTSSSDNIYSYRGRIKTTVNRPAFHEHKQTIHLWQFLKELLKQGDRFGDCIKWLDRSKGIFKIEDSTRVAKEWGRRKNRPAMNYDKLSRSIRQYYRKGIIKKTEHSKRLVYQFCPPYL